MCLRNVVIKHMTILAPLHSPNTDGIDPGTYMAQKSKEPRRQQSWSMSTMRERRFLTVVSSTRD
jgi:hypothetical protein